MFAAVEDHGTIVILTPLDDDAQIWFNENVEETAPRLGPSLAVEPRYLEDLVLGFADAGGELRPA
jgi:hypothetical protein